MAGDSNTHTYVFIQTIAVQYHTSSVRMGQPFIGGEQINIWNVWSMCYPSLILMVFVVVVVKNKYMFIIGNLKNYKKAEKKQTKLCIIISPKMITSIVHYVFLVNVFTYFFLKIGTT